MRPPRISLWIVNYNSAALIADSLISLKSEPIDEIYIWDNASGSSEVAALKKIASQDPRVRLFASTVNLGFGSAMNAIGDRAVSNPHDIIWLLNPDTQLLAGSVEALKDVLIHGSADIVSPVIVCGRVENPTLWFNGGGIDLGRGLCWHDDYGLANRSGHTEIRTTSFMTGAAPMMTRAVWDKVGGFHDGLFLYWEDVEFSLRASDLNLAMVVHPGCTIWHLEGGSGPSNSGHSTAYYFYNARNRIGVCADRTGKLRVALGPGLRETVLSVLRPLVHEKVGRITKCLAALQGTLAGLSKRRGLGPRRVPRRGFAVFDHVGPASAGEAIGQEASS